MASRYGYLNSFRFIDAVEFTDAYRKGMQAQDAQAVRGLLEALNGRMERLGSIPSYLLASYRGYEEALLWWESTDEQRRLRTGVVIWLDQGEGE